MWKGQKGPTWRCFHQITRGMCQLREFHRENHRDPLQEAARLAAAVTLAHGGRAKRVGSTQQYGGGRVMSWSSSPRFQPWICAGLFAAEMYVNVSKNKMCRLTVVFKHLDIDTANMVKLFKPPLLWVVIGWFQPSMGMGVWGYPTVGIAQNWLNLRDLGRAAPGVATSSSFNSFHGDSCKAASLARWRGFQEGVFTVFFLLRRIQAKWNIHGLIDRTVALLSFSKLIARAKCWVSSFRP